MIDKTILELTDRVAAYAIRATKAEYEVEFLKNQLEDEAKALTEATDLIKKLEAEIAELNATIESKEKTISYYYKENRRLEEELKKYDTDGNRST